MSTCGIPNDFAQGASVYESALRTMTRAMTANSGAGMPLASPAMLMAGPVLGLGMVAQYWGAVIGTLHGAAASAGRVPSIDAPFKAPVLFWNAEDEDSDSFGMAMANPMSFFAAATKTVYADMEHAAKDFVEVGEHVLSGMAEDADTVARTMEGAGSAAIIGPDEAADAAGAIMPEDFRRPSGMDRPEHADDLKRIAGIGPRLEEKLNGLGIWTFAQVAAWTPEQVAWVDDYLAFKGRIERDGWIAQASELAAAREDGNVTTTG